MISIKMRVIVVKISVIVNKQSEDKNLKGYG